MKLYRVLFGHRPTDPNAPVIPSIPKGMEGENATIPRICAAPTLDECLTSIGIYDLGRKAIEAVDYKNNRNARLQIPLTILTFEVDQDDPNLMLPDQVQQYVPDALMNREHWMLIPSFPVEVEQRWLYDGIVKEEVIVAHGRKHGVGFFKVEKCRTSGYTRYPTANFVQGILYSMCRVYDIKF